MPKSRNPEISEFNTLLLYFLPKSQYLIRSLQSRKYDNLSNSRILEGTTQMDGIDAMMNMNLLISCSQGEYKVGTDSKTPVKSRKTNKTIKKQVKQY